MPRKVRAIEVGGPTGIPAGPPGLKFFAKPTTVYEYAEAARIPLHEAARDVVAWRARGLLLRCAIFSKKFIKARPACEKIIQSPRKPYIRKVSPSKTLEIDVSSRKFRSLSHAKRRWLVYYLVSTHGPLPIKEMARVLNDRDNNGSLTRKTVQSLEQEGFLIVAVDATGKRMFDGGVLFEASPANVLTQPISINPTKIRAKRVALWRSLTNDVAGILRHWVNVVEIAQASPAPEHMRLVLQAGIDLGYLTESQEGFVRSSSCLFSDSSSVSEREKMYRIQEAMPDWARVPEIAERLKVSYQRAHVLVQQGVEDGSVLMKFAGKTKRYVAATAYLAASNQIPSNWCIKLEDTALDSQAIECLASIGVRNLGDLGKIPLLELKFIPGMPHDLADQLNDLLASNNILPESVPHWFSPDLLDIRVTAFQSRH